MARIEKLRLSPGMKRAFDQFVALRTSPLCRNDQGELLVSEEAHKASGIEDTDDVSVAVIELMLEWTNTFTNDKLATLRKNGQ